jgi:hypothetical protein
MVYWTKRNRKNTRQTRKKRIGGTHKACKDTNIPCTIGEDTGLVDKQITGKKNNTWKTCLELNNQYNHMLYITPQNVLLKNVETVRLPKFIVKYSENNVSKEGKCKIMIEDKYVGGFVHICGHWYAIMRLFGKTLNNLDLARPEKNKAFYKLSDIDIDLDPENTADGTSLISIPEDSYKIVKDNAESPKSKTPTIKMTKGFQNINKSSIVDGQSVFNLLWLFRIDRVSDAEFKFWLGADTAADAAAIATQVF